MPPFPAADLFPTLQRAIEPSAPLLIAPGARLADAGGCLRPPLAPKSCASVREQSDDCALPRAGLAARNTGGGADVELLLFVYFSIPWAP